MSPETPDRWEQRMSRGLDAHAGGADDAGWSLGEIRTRAHRIRRNRRLAASGGVLAAAAVLVPVALLAGPGVPRTVETPPVATSSASPSPAPSSPGASESPGTVTRSRAADPATAGAAYVEGRRLVRPDGSTLRLPEAYQSVELIGDSIVGVGSADNGDSSVEIVDADGTSIGGSLVSTPEIATNAAHTVVAWNSFGTMILAGPDGGSEEVGAVPETAVPVSVTGDCTPVSAGGETPATPGSLDGCRIWFDTDDGSDGPGGGDDVTQVMESDGSTSVAVPGAAALYDVGADEIQVVLPQSPGNGPGSGCTVLRDGVSGEELLETCDQRMIALSPDGRYVTATDPASDGFGLGYVTILDAGDGSEVARLESDGGSLQSPTWVSGSAVLVREYGPDGWSLRRLDVDGTDTLVASTTQGDDLTPGFVVPRQG